MKEWNNMDCNVERRIRKTNKALGEALIALLKEKKLNEISVCELTDRADINRGTFYLHYKNIYDLLYQMEANLLKELNTRITRYKISEIRQCPYLILEEFYCLLQEHSDFFQAMLYVNDGSCFANNLKQLLLENYRIAALQHLEYSDVLVAFITSGCEGLIRYWLENGFRETPKQLAQMTNAILLKSMEVIGDQYGREEIK